MTVTTAPNAAAVIAMIRPSIMRTSPRCLSHYRLGQTVR
jgi:hypothetical protein